MTKVHFYKTKARQKQAIFGNTFCGMTGQTTRQWGRVTCQRCLRHRKFALGQLKLVYVETP